MSLYLGGSTVCFEAHVDAVVPAMQGGASGKATCRESERDVTGLSVVSTNSNTYVHLAVYCLHYWIDTLEWTYIRTTNHAVQWNLRIMDTLGTSTLSIVQRLSLLRR